jgi:hypothetical protein
MKIDLYGRISEQGISTAHFLHYDRLLSLLVLDYGRELGV